MGVRCNYILRALKARYSKAQGGGREAAEALGWCEDMKALL